MRGKRRAIAQDEALLSISRAAQVCRCSRDIIRKRIAEHGVRPAGTERGFPLYPILQTVAAFLGVDVNGKTEAEGPPTPADPDRMPPAMRKSHYEAERLRLDLLERAGKLVHIEDVRDTLGDLFGRWATFLETFVDMIERGADMTPEQVELGRALIKAERQRLYEQITAHKRLESTDDGT